MLCKLELVKDEVKGAREVLDDAVPRRNAGNMPKQSEVKAEQGFREFRLMHHKLLLHEG